MTEAKGNGGEGLYVRRRSGQRDIKQGTYSAWSKSQGRSSRLGCYICQFEEHLKRDCPRYNHKKSQGCVRIEDHVFGSGADGYDTEGSYHITYMIDYLVDLEEYDGGNILIGDGRECRVRGDMYVSELRRNLILLGTLEKDGFIVKMQSSKIKVIKGLRVVLSRTRRSNCVYTLDGHVVTRKTLKSRKQLGEYQIGWKIKTGNILDFCNQRNMGFNESEEYKKTFIGSGVGTGSVQGLQGVEFEIEPQEDHTFKVEPHGNVDHVAGSQEVQTQDLIYYHLACDRDQHSTHELFSYREDSNEAAFAVAEAEKIYAHESLTFNNTVACEVISKWKAGLKDDMDARSDVYMLSNGCRKCSDDNDVYYWEYTPGMFIYIFLYIDGMVFSCGCKAEIWVTKGLLVKANGNVLGMKIVRDQSGNTLRVSHSRFYNGKLVQTLLEGHFILSLEGSLSGDCDVEKNGKWSCIYAVESQEYQIVYTRLDIASADVCMLDKFDRGLQTHVQVFVDFDNTMGYMTLMKAAKEAIGLKGHAIESGFELKIVAGIATSALSKAIPGPRFQHRLKLLRIEDF
ncbi:hypothetical protein Tco_0965327 [Tanacetum coccineum]